MDIRVLGPLQVWDSAGGELHLASQAQRRLLSLLASRANTIVTADSLEDHLGLTNGALRTSLSRLRRIVGADQLVTSPPGYELRTGAVDAIRFERLLDEATGCDEAAARERLVDALSLWRGEAYTEFSHEAWAAPEVARLTELRLCALEDLAELLADADDQPSALAMLEPVIDVQPFRDRSRALRLRALAQCGRRIDALREFQTYRELVIEETGTEPSPFLVSLDRAIAKAEADCDLSELPRPPVHRLHHRPSLAVHAAPHGLA